MLNRLSVNTPYDCINVVARSTSKPKCLATCPVSFLCIIQATITRSTKPKRLTANQMFDVCPQARCLATYFIENIIYCSVSVAIVLFNIVNLVRGDDSHFVRMHFERSVTEPKHLS